MAAGVAFALASAVAAPGVGAASPGVGAAAPAVRISDDFLSRLVREVRAALDQASLARGPALKPPVPQPVTWRARRLTSIDLGAPLLAMTAGDLDGDGRAEVVAITERDVVVLAARGPRALAEVARAPLPSDAPPVRPRDPVASALVVPAAGARATLVARASTAARGARYVLDGGDLREVAPEAGFWWCADGGAELVPGRNYFAGAGAGDSNGPRFARRCRDDLVDASGRPLRVDAALGTDSRLAVRVTARCGARDSGCTVENGVRVAVRMAELAGVGTAFEIADVDRDGRPEVIHAGAGAPGDADAIAVHALPRGAGTGGDKGSATPVFRRAFTGGVGGVVAADLDGDGDLEVLAAVRLAGAQRVDLWLLN